MAGTKGSLRLSFEEEIEARLEAMERAAHGFTSNPCHTESA